jgi:CheY-like chemotaxis protein
MDIQLPILDGYAATEKIREMGREVIIIAQTAYGLYNDYEKLLNFGFNDYIIKPIFADKLIEKLSGLVKG